jgi:hypothetical protein
MARFLQTGGRQYQIWVCFLSVFVEASTGSAEVDNVERNYLIWIYQRGIRHNYITRQLVTSRRAAPHGVTDRIIRIMAYLARGINRGIVLVHEDYRYKKNKETPKGIYWRCWLKSCHAPLTTNVFNLLDDEPTINVLKVGSLRERLRKIVR